MRWIFCPFVSLDSYLSKYYGENIQTFSVKIVILALGSGFISTYAHLGSLVNRMKEIPYGSAAKRRNAWCLHEKTEAGRPGCTVAEWQV